MRTLCHISAVLWLVAADGHAHGDLHQQITEISKQIERKPDAALYLKRGELEREHREFGKALEDYRKAAELAPGLDIIHFCRGSALAESGKNEAAREAFDFFITRVPSHGSAHLARARVLMELKLPEAAAEDYERAISLSAEPGPEPFLELSQARQMAGQTDDAIRALESGKKKLGAIPTLESAAITIETEAKRYDAALARVDRLIEAAARKESWQVLRAEILAESGRRDEARKAYQASLISIETLPARIRASEATRRLERKARAGLEGR